MVRRFPYLFLYSNEHLVNILSSTILLLTMPPKGKDAKGDSKSKTAAQGKGKPSGAGKGKPKDTGSEGASKGPKPAQSINVRHILCEKHARKEEALAALQSGRSFDDVAREFSEDKARQGGSLGWKTRGSLLAEFEKVAFELETSSTAKPKYQEVKTSEGYHLVMVEGRK